MVIDVLDSRCSRSTYNIVYTLYTSDETSPHHDPSYRLKRIAILEFDEHASLHARGAKSNFKRVYVQLDRFAFSKSARSASETPPGANIRSPARPIGRVLLHSCTRRFRHVHKRYATRMKYTMTTVFRSGREKRSVARAFLQYEYIYICS